MPENQSQVESLEELRRIDPQNETDPIKLKLAEIFSLSELDLYNDLISDQQRLQQIKLIEEVDRIRDWILQKLRERNEEAKKIEQLIESVDYLSRADKHASDLKYFPEVKDIVNNLSSFADALKFIDDFKSSSEITEDQMLKLIDLLQSFFIEFDQKMIDDYQSLFTDSKSVSNKVRKILFKIRAKKSRAIYEGTNASIMDLQNEVTKKLHESISSIIEQIKSQIERIDIDAVDDGDGYLEIFSEFNKLEMLVIQNAHNSLSVIIPEELASLPRIVEKLLDEFRHKLRLSKEEKIAQLNDPSSVIIGAQTKLEDCLNETDIVLPQAREQVTSLVTLISGHSTNGGSKFNQEISELLEGKRFAHFLISRPHELRRQLYNMYLNSELPREKSEQSSSQVQSSENQDSQRLNSDRVTNILIPIGGGKDSAVSLEILETEMLRVNNLNIWSNSNQTSKAKQTGNSNQTSKAKQTGNSNQTGDSNQTGNSNGVFVVNPTRASLDLISAKKMQNVIIVDRSIDPKLIELNSQGYLNGHVPISSLFAFLSVFCADLFGFSHVAVSNERSSNEGNVQFFDHEINHQYSKTFEFETDFQDYSRKFLPADSPFYFSFLRPLYELQIAKIFSGNSDLNSGMKKYHHIFRSCNRGQKTNSWCGECSKCLFAYVILFPFMKSEEINSYFGKNMFDDLELWPIAQEILGAGAKKPLDCVGTHEETIVAFYLSIKKIQKSNQQLPALVEKINLGIISKEDNLDQRTNAILNAWNDENSLPKELVKVLKKYV